MTATMTPQQIWLYLPVPGSHQVPRPALPTPGRQDGWITFVLVLAVVAVGVLAFAATPALAGW